MLHAVHERRRGQGGSFENGGGDIDHVAELGTDLATRGEAVGPMDDGPVAGPTPVRGDLLGPLVGRVHGVRPTDGVVVVGLRAAEHVDLRRHELDGFQRRRTVEDQRLVEGAIDRALSRRAVVADDVIHEGVIEHAQVPDGVDQATDVMVGVRQEPGVHLHLTSQHRLQVVGHVVPRRDLLGPGGEFGVPGDDPHRLLLLEDLRPQRVPPAVEATPVALDPVLRYVMRRVCRARREVHEERFVRNQRLLLTHPRDGVVGQVLGEVVALLRSTPRLHRGRALIQRWMPLVGFAADEPEEVLEPAAAGGPGVERSQRAGLIHRHLMALAELRGRIAVQLERLGQRRRCVRSDAGVARGRRGDFRDATHADRVVVAAGE